MEKYSAGNIDWFLMEEGLQGIVEQFSHSENTRRDYRIYDYQGGKVFIKSFLETGFVGRVRHLFTPRGKTEFLIGNHLTSLGIPAPKVLGYGIGRNTSSVVEEYIEGHSLLYAIKKTADQSRIFTLLADLLVQLKLKHIRHNDLHLDNVLIQGDKLYLIDLHKTKVKKIFSGADEVSNVTHALGIIYDDISDQERDFFFTQHGCNHTFRQQIERKIAKLKKDWITSKKKRAFRNTSLLKISEGHVHIKGSEERIQREFIATLKKDKKVRIERFSDHIRKVYRHWRRLKAAWENHVALAYLGSGAVPQPFYVKLPTAFSRGYVAMEDLGHKGIELDRFLDGKYDDMSYSERRTFIKNLSEFFLSLFRQRITHRDLKGCNIFALHDGRFMLLDVEDIVFEEIREETLKRMLAQLNTTIPARITMQDRMRFFLSLTASLKMNKKHLFRYIEKESLENEIVYEGTSGLKSERW